MVELQVPDPVAVIDVGTNSVKLLVAGFRGATFRALHEASSQTRLGTGFYQSRVLRQDAIDLTAVAVGDFAKLAKSYGASRIVCVGTSAARDALNSDDLVRAIRLNAGLRLNVLSGDDEAELAFQGVLSDAGVDSRVHLAADVGGGSTELILGDRTRLLARRSFPLGAIRLAEKFPLSESPDPAEHDRCRAFVVQFLHDQVLPFLKPHSPLNLASLDSLISACGTATILARMHMRIDSYDRDRLDGCRIPTATIEQLNACLWTTPLSSRRMLVGLPPDRADIMPFGTLILVCLLQALKTPDLVVSMRGLRFGIAKRLQTNAAEFV